MTEEEFSAAQSIWKCGYAEECFRRVADTCEFILQNRIDYNHPAYYPLIVAIYALYGKPFKDTEIVGAGLPKKIVPAEFRKLHDVMLKHRDEVYAHTEPGPESEAWIRVSRTDKGRVGQLISTEFYALPPKLPLIIKLCQAVGTAVEQRRVELQNRHFDKHMPKEEGDYPLNVFDREGPFFLPKQPPSKNHP